VGYERGAIVVATDPFGGNNERPYLVISNESHPFRDEELLALLEGPVLLIAPI
jgi:hypothetical protein